ncbi:MAG: DUF934 domain-containing protein [Pseudomonadota bacterium]
MPLIKNKIEIENEWVFVDEEEELPPTGQIVMRLAQFLENADALLSRNVPIGVRLSPDSDPHDLAPYLDRLGLIEVDFPKYVDGRGYSQAQLLRRRLDYKGELRAVGHVLLDQIFYMNRSGFDAYSTTRADLPNVLRALEEFSEVYQLAAAGRTSVFHKRHMAKDEIG